MDVIIIGTGVSALLLAQSLIRRNCFETLRLIGPRRPLRPHLLSYWSDRPTPFDSHAEASWSVVRFFDGDAREIRLSLSRFAYRTFRAQKWFAQTLAEVQSAPRVELIEARVEAITDVAARATVHAGDASFHGDWVFSSAPVSGQSPACWQRFAGWEVALPDGELDTTAATLLDFRTLADGDFRFMYALPLGPRRLFVEHVAYQPCEHERHLTIYLRDVLGLKDWQVIDREQGATPVYRDPPPRRIGRVVSIGVAGGLAKASTGYAVMRMWRDAEGIAEGLQRSGRPRLWSRPPSLYRVADHYFIDLLSRAPTRIPGLLTASVGGGTGDAVLAFLDDRARLNEQLAVATATPGWLRWWSSGKL